MAVVERSTTLRETPEDALQSCARALTAAGFKNVQANQPAMMVTAQKRSMGQWTKDQVTITIKPATDGSGGSDVTVLAQATAQSLASLVSKPAERMADKVVAALGR